MKYLSSLDVSWLYVEAKEAPMNVAILQIFARPKDAAGDFVQELVAHLKSGRDFQPPWNQKLWNWPLAKVVPVWVSDNDLDLSYHVRHWVLPPPGGERELGILVSRLHSVQFDFKRPLWECH